VVNLAEIVKANDVRGLVGSQLDERVAAALGVAFARFVSSDNAAVHRVVIGYDMRDSSPVLAGAFGDGVLAAGLDVLDVGQCSTDALYYASGAFDAPGAMFTASHNPASYNGMKLCRSGARPVGLDSGLDRIRDEAQALLDDPSWTVGEAAGTRGPQDILRGYAEHLRGLVQLSPRRRLKVVVDAGNGMAGLTTPAVLGSASGLAELPLEIVPLYFELDGTFPNHEANPLDPANLVDLQKAVPEHGADLGLAFDGDADRCFVVDERGEIVSPSTLTALIAVRELAREPGSTIIHNLITSRAVPEIVEQHGGTAVRTRVGHSFIKAEMARTGAVFGGEHSGHFYFRDFWNADSGMLAALHTLAALGGTNGTLSALLTTYSPYAPSGEINSTVKDQAAKVAEIKKAYDGLEQDELDGLTVSSPDGWWFNVRASNTEPLLRLNVEAPDEATMARVRDEVLGLIRG
jgi:phosphomannomutase